MMSFELDRWEAESVQCSGTVDYNYNYATGWSDNWSVAIERLSDDDEWIKKRERDWRLEKVTTMAISEPKGTEE